MAKHTVFTKEELARAKMSEDTIKFYSSNPDALKELILERKYFKAISELQQKRINEFTKELTNKIDKINNIIPKPVLSYAYIKYYEDLYTKLDFSSFAKF